MSGYEEDILIWSERQGELLRRIARGERVNDADLDWLNIAEEIESVGRSELRACEALLRQALVHMLKIKALPASPAAPGWQEEVIRFRQEAADAFTPSMRQRIDLGRVYRQALQRLPTQIDGQPSLPVPQDCPVTLDELLAGV
jgi:uncharacterized protein DUF29